MEEHEDKILIGDAGEVLQTLPRDFVDLTVTSPPYDTLRSYKGYTFDVSAIISGLWRVTRPGGVVVWVVGDETVDGDESGTSFRQVLAFKDAGFKLFDTMLYEKTGTSYPSTGRYTQIFEYMFVLSKGALRVFHPIQDVPKLWEGSYGKTTTRQKDGTLKESGAKNSGKGKSGRADVVVCPQCGFTTGGAPYGFKQRSNIWRIVNGKRFAHTDELAYGHPATFPEKLAEDHILTWTDPGDLVLDPMCGSGTTLKMARKNGRRCLGIDISAEYCRLAVQRVRLGGERA